MTRSRARGVHRVTIVLLAVATAARAEPFLVLPSSGFVTTFLPGAELIDGEAGAWSAGAGSRSLASGITWAHAALATRGRAVGAQLSFSRFGTAFYEELRAVAGFGGTGPSALAVTLEVRRARAGRSDRLGVGAGLGGRVRAGALELSAAAAPERRSGSHLLFPGGMSLCALVVEEGARAGLSFDAREGGSVALESFIAVGGESRSIGASLVLTTGALRIGVTPLDVPGLHLTLEHDPLLGTSAGLELSARRGAGAGPW